MKSAVDSMGCEAEKDALVRAESISAGYGASFALEDISFQVCAGEVWGLIGPNGSGKTTLLRALSGILPLNHGQVWLRNRPLGALPDRERARILAIVPQTLDVPIPLTVWELASQGRLPYVSGWSPFSPKDTEVIARALEMMELTSQAHRWLDELSAGERQRAIVALALAQEPQVLALDEPTAHMDVQHADSLLRRIRRITRECGLAVVASLHDFNLAMTYCDHVLLLENGRLVGKGRAADVLNSANLERVYKMPIEVLRRSDGVSAVVPLYGAEDGASSAGSVGGAAAVSAGF